MSRIQFVKIFHIQLIVVFLSIPVFSQTISVGSGSYSTTLPAGEVGPQTFSGANAIPKVSSGFNKPIQTNDFWSTLIYPFFGNPHSNPIYAQPINAKAVAGGLEIGYTDVPIYVANDYLFPYQAQLTVGVNGLSVNQTLTHDYGDWTVTALWDDGPISMEATLGHGLPYVFFTITGGNAVINCTQTPAIWHNQNEVLGITVNGKHYGIFAPTGSTWSGSNILESSLNGKDFLSIALLPDNAPSTLELFRTHAYAFVTNSLVEWQYNETTAELITDYRYETVLKDSSAGNLNETMSALYRHQWLNTFNPLTSHTYVSPRGEMKLHVGNTFKTNLQFSGVLPALPNRGDYNPAELLGHVQDAATEILPVGPTYENGKLIARFSNLVHIADQIGAVAERDHFLNEIKSRLEEWFSAGGPQEYSYIDEWDVLTGYPSGFGADNQINDHHFHAAYAIMSAATVALYDSAWAAQDNWGGMVNLLIKDANNWQRSDTQFPFLRTHDAYAGHSWAAGHGDFAEGNNQESSSESMNFAAATILWGEATQQQEIRDLGIFLHATETTAAEQYWFDVENEVFPQPYPRVAIGMVWGGKGVYSTWFGSAPEFIHGINILPITGGSLYLGRHPSYVLDNYNAIVSERGSQPVIWKDILWEYLALADANLALSYYYADPNYMPFDGESRAHTLHWLFNLKKMGHVSTDIFADVPTYSVFRDQAGDITYVALNAGSTNRLVTFSDGFSMTVAPGELKSHSTSSADPNAPVVLLFADETSGKAPLQVNFTGSSSFDRNGSPLTYNWDFGGGITATSADTAYTFTTVGTYTVKLTVTNNQALSSTDSITISILDNGTPWTGTPVTIPAVVQAEFYDLGGEGVAYHDSDPTNNGVPFRSNEGVDIEASNDVGGGYDISWIEDGEWVEYTINVPQDGLYDVVPVVASVPGGGKLRIKFNGVDVTGQVDVPVTGGWQFWEEVVIPNIPLSAGTQVMHVDFYNGQFNLNWIEIRQPAVGIGDEANNAINRFELLQNYPNPFNPTTQISFNLPRASITTVEVYNVRGQLLETLLNEHLAEGKHTTNWDASDYPSGVYFYRLNSGERSQSKKMMLLK